MIDSKLPDKVPDYPTAGPVPEEWDRTCETCGYSLTGLVGTTRCPECGTHFNPFELPHARIPWLEIHRIGFVQRFLLTLFDIFISPVSFAKEVRLARRVNLSAAIRFKYCCITLAAGATAVYWIALLMANEATRPGGLELSVAVSISCILFVATWLYLFLSSLFPILLREAGSRDDLSAACMQQYSTASALLFPPIAGLVIVRNNTVELIGIVCLAGYCLATLWLRILLTRVAARLNLLETVGASLVLVFWCFLALIISCFVGAALVAILSMLAHSFW